MAFYTVFENVALMLCYIVSGWLITKTNKAVTEHARSISGILVYVSSPCMIINAFQQMDPSLSTLADAGIMFVLAGLLMTVFFCIMYVFLRKKHADARYRIMTIAAATGNTGFFGAPLLMGVLPGNTNVVCWCMMYTAAMNVVLFTAGVFMLTHDKKHMSLKSALLNPVSVSTYAAIMLYLLNIRFPEGIGSKVQLVGNMATPLCMISLGMRIASMELKQIFLQPFAYIVSAFKLIVYPLFVLAAVSLIPGIPETMRVTLYIASCTPCAVMVLSLAELHMCEQKLSANVVVLSTMLSLVTLPLMTLLI